jgi:hypothetical protein
VRERERERERVSSREDELYVAYSRKGYLYPSVKKCKSYEKAKL